AVPRELRGGEPQMLGQKKGLREDRLGRFEKGAREKGEVSLETGLRKIRLGPLKNRPVKKGPFFKGGPVEIRFLPQKPAIFKIHEFGKDLLFPGKRRGKNRSFEMEIPPLHLALQESLEVRHGFFKIGI